MSTLKVVLADAAAAYADNCWTIVMVAPVVLAVETYPEKYEPETTMFGKTKTASPSEAGTERTVVVVCASVLVASAGSKMEAVTVLWIPAVVERKACKSVRIELNALNVNWLPCDDWYPMVEPRFGWTFTCGGFNALPTNTPPTIRANAKKHTKANVSSLVIGLFR